MSVAIALFGWSDAYAGSGNLEVSSRANFRSWRIFVALELRI
ncbi:hypothetical protein FHT28_001656 [Rhizobium sp. SG570]|nr:hypothetical protein [Rhizobium sp. SG570]